MLRQRVFYILLLLSCLFSCKEKRQQEQEPVLNLAQIVFSEKDFDLGEIPVSSPIRSHDFEFTNESNYPLIIQKVEPRCHCTSAEYPKEPVPPGGKGFIRVIFDGSDTSLGHFSRNTIVYSNSVNGSQIALTVTGSVVEP